MAGSTLVGLSLCEEVVFRCAVHNLEMKHVPECAASTVAVGTCATNTEGVTYELRHPKWQNEYRVSLKEVVTC